jgi:hypothetical protein
VASAMGRATMGCRRRRSRSLLQRGHHQSFSSLFRCGSADPRHLLIFAGISALTQGVLDIVRAFHVRGLRDA